MWGADVLPDTPTRCQAELIKEACPGLEVESDNEGQMPDDDTLKQLRHAAYREWAKIAGIWGIRVQPPPCVLE